MVVVVRPSADEVGASVGELVLRVSQEAIATHGRFTLALSGGSLPKILNKGLGAIQGDVDYYKWHVFFADERCVPLDSDDSNYKACKEALFDHVAIPAAQIYTIDASLSPEAAAVEYTTKLAQVWGNELPRFDLILLGMGPDGHTCSLFPGHKLLKEDKLFVASIEDSPKPPPQRITLTYPVVNNADHVAFVATGSSKAELMPHMVGREQRDPPLPAADVKPTHGVVYWYIDQDAAAKLASSSICGEEEKISDVIHNQSFVLPSTATTTSSSSMTGSSHDQKKTVLVAAACVAALAGLGVWARSQQRKKLVAQRKQLTNLRFDLSVEEIEAETASIIAKMQQADDEIAALAPSSVTYENTAQKLIDLDFEMLSRMTNVTFLGHVSAVKEIRDACNKADEAITDFSVKRGMRVDVYKSLHKFASSPAFKKLTPVKQRYVSKVVQDFERNGLKLEEAKQQEVQAWKQKLSKLALQYQMNLTEETTEVSFSLDKLKGLSDDFIGSLEKGSDGKFKIALSYPTVFPILNTCTVPLTRKTVEVAFNRRCIDKNVAILEEMLELRHNIAITLGYENHASYVLEQRMAKSPESVKKFLSDLDNKLTPLAKRDLDLLLKLKEKDCETQEWKFDGKINMWDFRFYMDQYVKQHCSIDSEKVREFFPLDHVTNELLSMYQEILSLKFAEISQPHVWHKDVRMFAVYDARPSRAGRLVGHFYLDLFPRQGKYGHAACFTLQQSCVNSANVRELPAAAMVANFNAPTKTKPSLLDHNEVVTYFHEFGHVMHCLCSEAEIPRFAGTRVERDFVEAPSQMLENWCWQKEPLQRLSSHYLSKAKLSDDLIERLISTKNANAGLMNKRQLLFATFDQQIHSKAKSDTAKVLKQLQSEIMLIDMTPGTNFAASFGHLAGGYDAQYYGYMWSEVFSMDMFVSRFKKEGLMNPKTGLAYRELILSRGGSLDASEQLQEFLGREPNQDAFLLSKGLSA